MAPIKIDLSLRVSEDEAAHLDSILSTTPTAPPREPQPLDPTLPPPFVPQDRAALRRRKHNVMNKMKYVARKQNLAAYSARHEAIQFLRGRQVAILECYPDPMRVGAAVQIPQAWVELEEFSRERTFVVRLSDLLCQKAAQQAAAETCSEQDGLITWYNPFLQVESEKLRTTAASQVIYLTPRSMLHLLMSKTGMERFSVFVEDITDVIAYCETNGGSRPCERSCPTFQVLQDEIALLMVLRHFLTRNAVTRIMFGTSSTVAPLTRAWFRSYLQGEVDPMSQENLLRALTFSLAQPADQLTSNFVTPYLPSPPSSEISCISERQHNVLIDALTGVVGSNIPLPCLLLVESVSQFRNLLLKHFAAVWKSCDLEDYTQRHYLPGELGFDLFTKKLQENESPSNKVMRSFALARFPLDTRTASIILNEYEDSPFKSVLVVSDGCAPNVGPDYDASTNTYYYSKRPERVHPVFDLEKNVVLASLIPRCDFFYCQNAEKFEVSSLVTEGVEKGYVRHERQNFLARFPGDRSEASSQNMYSLLPESSEIDLGLPIFIAHLMRLNISEQMVLFGIAIPQPALEYCAKTTEHRLYLNGLIGLKGEVTPLGVMTGKFLCLGPGLSSLKLLGLGTAFSCSSDAAFAAAADLLLEYDWEPTDVMSQCIPKLYPEKTYQVTFQEGNQLLYSPAAVLAEYLLLMKTNSLSDDGAKELDCIHQFVRMGATYPEICLRRSKFYTGNTTPEEIMILPLINSLKRDQNLSQKKESIKELIPFVGTTQSLLKALSENISLPAIKPKYSWGDSIFCYTSRIQIGGTMYLCTAFPTTDFVPSKYFDCCELSTLPLLLIAKECIVETPYHSSSQNKPTPGKQSHSSVKSRTGTLTRGWYPPLTRKWFHPSILETNEESQGPEDAWRITSVRRPGKTFTYDDKLPMNTTLSSVLVDKGLLFVGDGDITVPHFMVLRKHLKHVFSSSPLKASDEIMQALVWTLSKDSSDEPMEDKEQEQHTWLTSTAYKAPLCNTSLSKNTMASDTFTADRPEPPRSVLQRSVLDRVVSLITATKQRHLESKIQQLSALESPPEILKEVRNLLEFLTPSNELHRFYESSLLHACPSIPMAHNPYDTSRLLLSMTQRSDSAGTQARSEGQKASKKRDYLTRLQQEGIIQSEPSNMRNGTLASSSEGLMRHGETQTVNFVPRPANHKEASSETRDSHEAAEAAKRAIDHVFGGEEDASHRSINDSRSARTLSDFRNEMRPYVNSSLRKQQSMQDAVASSHMRSAVSAKVVVTHASEEELVSSIPAVLVEPIPVPKGNAKLNIPLILAKALGEAIGAKVGPTSMLEGCGHIQVHTREVEQDALRLGTFMCLGQSVRIRKNCYLVTHTNETVTRKLEGIRNKNETSQYRSR